MMYAIEVYSTLSALVADVTVPDGQAQSGDIASLLGQALGWARGFSYMSYWVPDQDPPVLRIKVVPNMRHEPVSTSEVDSAVATLNLQGYQAQARNSDPDFYAGS